MSSRDIYSRDGGRKIRDLLASWFISRLIAPRSDRATYLISPWLSDFKLLDNRLGQFRDLFTYRTGYGANPHILFSEAITEMSDRCPIRIVTWPDVISQNFALHFEGECGVVVRYEAEERDHQKGFLSDDIYFEGSMNFTYSGLYKRHEKVISTMASDTHGRGKIEEAYLEFDRIWQNLGGGH